MKIDENPEKIDFNTKSLTSVHLGGPICASLSESLLHAYLHANKRCLAEAGAAVAMAGAVEDDAAGETKVLP